MKKNIQSQKKFYFTFYIHLFAKIFFLFLTKKDFDKWPKSWTVWS
jgi:hypothetical protein